LPLISDNWESSRFGPVFTLIAVSLIGYAIVRHRLFDIRLYAIRSLAYVLSASVLALLYVIPAVLLTTYVLRTDVDAKTLTALVIITLGVAFFFQSVRKFFDTATKRLFYRDAYDPQDLFNRFNKLLVATVDVDKLLRNATGLVVTNLKSEFCTIGLLRTGKSSIRLSGTGASAVTKEGLERIQVMLKDTRVFPVVTDMLEQEHHDLKVLLERNGIAMIAPLFEHPNAELGYLILGSKKSGSPYTDQDCKVVSSLANELSLAMQNALRFEEIEKFNATLQDKIDDATRKLRRTNEKLRTLDETKDEFITMASHQLRTPLTSVKGYLSMVLEGDAGKLSKQQRQLLTQSFISSQRMVYLIADLLNLSRLNTGKFVIEPTSVDLSEVVQGEIDQLRETAKSRNLSLVYERPANFPPLMLDETKIHQVVMNFIDNAIYYTPSGGTITIELRDTPTSVEYRVIDNGIGVPKTEQHRLFTKFYRAGNARRARPDGTGLGLFMAKKVIAAQGGTVLFESEEGKGSMFGFRFSKARHLAPGVTEVSLSDTTK
jgi:signal transduction histidine kinase